MMGFWPQNEQGHSFAHSKTRMMIWGDRPADIIDEAVTLIIDCFKQRIGRPPSREELHAGLDFHLNPMEDLHDHNTDLTTGGANGN